MKAALRKLRDCGVVGAGGAGFPTYFKYAQKVDALIVNAAECEPLINVDKLIIERYAPELLAAIKKVAKFIQARQVIFAIKKKYEGAVKALEASRQDFPELKLHFLPDVYPAGDEILLVYETLGKVVPEGGIPLHVGAVVSNVETLFNVFNCLQKGEPVTHTWLTIAGEVTTPLTARLPLGVPVRDVLPLAGNSVNPEEHMVLEGGVMMGKLVEDWDAPITKTTKALIVLRRTHPLALRYLPRNIELYKNMVAICCDCKQCTLLCPRYQVGHTMEPHRLMVAYASGVSRDDPIFDTAFYCCECGICELMACFMWLNPRTLNAHLKKTLGRKPRRFSSQFKPLPFYQHTQLPMLRVKAHLGIMPLEREPELLEKPELEISRLRLPLQHHMGVPAAPLVKTGERVKAGQIVAITPDDQLGVGLHTPLAGKIERLSSEEIIIKT